MGLEHLSELDTTTLEWGNINKDFNPTGPSSNIIINRPFNPETSAGNWDITDHTQKRDVDINFNFAQQSAPLSELSYKDFYKGDHSGYSETTKRWNYVTKSLIETQGKIDQRIDIRYNNNPDWRSSGFSGKEPYIVTSIGDRKKTSNSRSGYPARSMLTDLKRIGKYLISKDGISFMVKQNALGRMGQEYHRFYSPLSTLLSPTIRVTRGFPFDIFSNYETRMSVPGPTQPTIGDKYTSVTSLVNVNTSIKPLGSSSDLFTTEPIAGDSLWDNKYNQAIWKKEMEPEKSGAPFYFRDLRTGEVIFFRAYIESLTENVSPSWTPTNYIGRSEPVYIYERAERDISFTLKLFAHTMDELDMIYEKINRLTSFCYPEYNKDEDNFVGLNKLRMKPPLLRLRYADLYGGKGSELLGFIQTLTYSYPETSPWETKQGKRVPKHIIVNIGYKIIHDTVPRLGSKFYGYDTLVEGN